MSPPQVPNQVRVLPVSVSKAPPTDSVTQNQVLVRLHPRVQDLIRNTLGWRHLRDVQVQAAHPILETRNDVLVIAGTASGKTEAAWFPIFSELLTHTTPGIGVLCVSPTKALIDDQARRLSTYGRNLDLEVQAWHGDIAASRKSKTLRTPPTALIITPESLQSLTMHKSAELERALAHLRFVVIDEIHAFAGTERGQQVQSLLHHLETRLRRRIPRIALSATVSAPDLMTQFLRPSHGHSAIVVLVTPSSLDLDVRLQGVYRSPPRVNQQDLPDEIVELRASDVSGGDRLSIARHIDTTSRGKRTLVFARSRREVELLTALLRDASVTGTCRGERFLAHHGSLAPELRRAAESALHEHRDTVVVCTTTLELGVDLPDLDQVVQVDASPSVASLRQRLGRSGRRAGTRPALRIYATENPSPPPNDLCSRLRVKLVQNIATVELIVKDNWVEPPDLASLGLSTLIHQTLALLHDPNGRSAQDAWHLLCETGPWQRVSAADYADLLRSLAAHALIRQDARGRLLLDAAGHLLVGRRDFLAVFSAYSEYSIRHKGKLLGTVPALSPLRIGSNLAFGGRTWQVIGVLANGWTVEVMPHTHGLPPHFFSTHCGVHRRVRQVMRRVYESTDIPEYLDETAAALLAQARDEYRALDLHQQPVIAFDSGCLLALWTGDRELATIERWIDLRHPGRDTAPATIGLRVGIRADQAREQILELLAAEEPTPTELARGVVNKEASKYDRFLPEQLLTDECASRTMDVPSARAALEHAFS